MTTKIIVTGIIAVLFLVFAIVFLMGKGDKLIAPFRLSSAMIKIQYWRLLAFLSL